MYFSPFPLISSVLFYHLFSIQCPFDWLPCRYDPRAWPVSWHHCTGVTSVAFCLNVSLFCVRLSFCVPLKALVTLLSLQLQKCSFCKCALTLSSTKPPWDLLNYLKKKKSIYWLDCFCSIGPRYLEKVNYYLFSVCLDLKKILLFLWAPYGGGRAC